MAAPVISTGTHPLPNAPAAVLPVQGSDEMADAGVVFGARLFHARHLRRVELPDGWEGLGERGGLWTHITDQYGRQRAEVCWTYPGQLPVCTLVRTVRSYVLQTMPTSDPLVLDTRWATRNVVLEVLDERRSVLGHIVSTGTENIAQHGDYQLGDSTAGAVLVGTRRKLAQFEQLREQVLHTPELPG